MKSDDGEFWDFDKKNLMYSYFYSRILRVF